MKARKHTSKLLQEMLDEITPEEMRETWVKMEKQLTRHKTTDYRIGNYVTLKSKKFPEFHKKIYIITSISGDGKITLESLKHGDSLTVELNVDDIIPIRLSKCWLKWLGFRPKKNVEWVYEKYPIEVNIGNHNIVAIQANLNTTILPVQMNGYKVHQLQNLYYCMQQTELT